MSRRKTRRARRRQRGHLRLAVVIPLICGCAPPEELPVVATGRWVELATDRDEPICGGTLALLDGLVGAAFAYLGETPPERVFVRYEWLDERIESSSLVGHGQTTHTTEMVIIRSDQLVHEHEIGHVVPALSWPTAPRFLREGLAVLLDGRRYFDQDLWPSSKTIDEVIDGDFAGGRNYWESWFLVSQIVRDHGVDGLKSLWFEVEADADAAEVRKAYESLFGRPMEALLEPLPADESSVGGPRVPCRFALCPQEAQPLEGGSVVAPGPAGCEGDPHAIGPHSRSEALDGPPVWRETVVVPMVRWADAEPSGNLFAAPSPCFLECYRYGQGRAVFGPDSEQWNLALRPAGPWRIEVRRDLESLPTDDPGGITVFELSD